MARHCVKNVILKLIIMDLKVKRRIKMSYVFENLEFKVHSSGFEKSDKEGRRLIRGYCSTSDLDRQQEVISRKALEKAKNDLLNNHTVFIEHNHSSLMACGKVIDCILDEKGLLITVELSKAKFVDDIWTLCEEKILNSFSIGGIVIDGHDERGEDGKSYHVIDELAILEVSIVGLPANPAAKFQPIYKSFNSAIAEQIKQKEESQKMAKLDKQEVLKSEAPNASKEATQEPIKVEEPKEQAAPEVVEKEAVVEAPKVIETPLEAAVEKTVEVAKEETKPAEVALEAPKEEIKKEEVIEAPKVSEEAPKETVEKAKVDETPSEENPNPGLVVEDAEKAEWTTEYINTLPNSSFAVIEPAYLEGKTEDKNCRHLPFKNENGEVDLPHYRNALARVNQIKPVTDSISEADLRSQAAAELEKYRDLLGKESEKSTDEKILDALALIIEKLSALDKKDEVIVEEKEETLLDQEDGTDIEKAKWTVAYINTLPNSSFAVIEPAYLDGKTENKNCRHLPFKDENGKVDLPHYRNALARANQIKPITDSISTEDLRSKAVAELEKYRDMLGKTEPKKEEKKLEVVEDKVEKTVEKKEEVEVEKTVEKKEDVPTRKSLAIVVPSPYEDETNIESNPKEAEKNKNMGWSKLIFGK
jgi:HK97 family phage prohead protease